MLGYLERVGIALSILLNVLVGGPSNQTFSARNYRWKMMGQPNLVWMIDRILWFDSDHCLHSWIYYKTTRDLRKYINDQKKEVDSHLKMIYYTQDYYE